MEDDLRAEYDLKSLRVRRFGSKRKSFGGTTVRLEPDVAEIFPSADAVTENSGDVAMVLITADQTVYINEDATEQLLKEWPLAYKTNLKRLIPMMAEELANDIISVNGVETR